MSTRITTREGRLHSPESGAGDGFRAALENENESRNKPLHREDMAIFAALFQDFPLSVQIFAPDGRTLAVNKAWQDLWRVDFASLENYNVLHDSQLEEKGVIPYIRRGFAGESVMIPPIFYSAAQTLGLQDAREFWVQAYLYPVRDAQGEILRLVLAHQDVTDIHNAQAALQEETESLETLNRIGQMLAAELDLDKLVQAVTDAATELCDAQFGAFFYNLVDESGESYTLYSISGVPREKFSQFPMPRNTRVFNPTFKGECVVRADDITKDPRYGHNEPHFGMPKGHLPVRSYLAVPVISRSGQVLGGLFFGHEKAGVFSARHERILEGVAAQTAVAMDNAQLYQEARRERARALQNEEHYRFLAEAIPQIVWTTSGAGEVDYFNSRWYDYTGSTPEQSNGWGWEQVIHPEDLSLTQGRWTHSLRTGEPYEIEYRLRRGDGAYRWFLGRGLPLRDASGEIIRWLGTCTDIDDQKRAEEERARLLEAEQSARRDAEVARLNAEAAQAQLELALCEVEAASRAKDEFLAVLSHELRTPLTATMGWVNLLRDRVLDEEMQAQALEALDRSTKTQAQLIGDLLDVSRIITGNLRLEMKPLELVPVIEAAVEAVRSAAEAKNVHLLLRLDPWAGPVAGDATRLQQIVWNLLANAIKFTPRAGRVEVALERVESQVQISVTDTGKGIAADFVPFVFDRFRQADSTNTRRYGGLGLGLSIVRHLVELHGGTVAVESEGENKGATFTVRLPILPVRLAENTPLPLEKPRVENATALESGLRVSHGILQGTRVLLVEDEDDSRALLKVALGLYGADVRAASSVAQALEMLESAASQQADWWPDAIVSDIGMPGENGYTFMARLRSLPPEKGGDLPAIALTAYARREDRVQALAAGFGMHVPKPVEPDELAVAIAALLGKPIETTKEN
jgi:PAS domain S-box-containing protein